MNEFAAIIEMRRRRQAASRPNFGAYGIALLSNLKEPLVPLDPGATLDAQAQDALAKLASGAAHDVTEESRIRVKSSYPGRGFVQGIGIWGGGGDVGRFIWIFRDGSSVRTDDHVNTSGGITGALKSATQAVTTYVVKPAIATSAAMLTGGVSVLAGEKSGSSAIKSTLGVKPALTGFAIGAAGGTAAAAVINAPAIISAVGTKLGASAAAVATSLGVSAGLRAAGISPPPAQPSPTPVAVPVTPSTSGDGASGSRAAVLAGLGIGFVAGGPLGAVFGGIAGAIIASRRQS